MSALTLLILVALRETGAAVRPLVTFTPNWSEILYWDRVTITCDVGSTAPENQTYYWYKDGERITDKHQQSFKIEMVDRKDEGYYQCRTSTGDLSPPLTLKAKDGYLILQRPPIIYEGDPLTLRCHSILGKGTNTTFFKEEKWIKFSVNDSELHIDAIDGGASGMYRCTKMVRLIGDPKYHYYSAETCLSVLARPPDYTVPNIIKLLLSGLVLMAAAGIIIFYKKSKRQTSSDGE